MTDRNPDISALRYPRLMRRVEAVLLDALVFVFVFLVGMNLLAPLAVHGGIKAGVIALLILVLEPGLVSRTGSSIGHHLRGLRVQDAGSGANIGFPRAFLRFVVKNLLGWCSVVFMLVTRRYQALHDLAVRSVVVLKHPDRMAEGHALEERQLEEADYIYPSWLRRITAIVLWVIAGYVALTVPVLALSSDACFYQGKCNEAERAMEGAAGVAALVLFAVVLVLGCTGRLWGARRTSTSAGDEPSHEEDT